MATSQGCSGSHPPEYHCSGCDPIGQQYRFMLAAWAHPIGCHSVYIWAHCSGAHPIATHTDYPYRLSSLLGSHRIAIWYISGLAIRACTHAALVGLSPDCHSLDIWSRCLGAHPIATHTFSLVRLLTRLPFGRCLGLPFGRASDCYHADLHASQALTRLPFGIYVFSPFGHTPNCYPCSAGWALTRLPFARYLVLLFGSAPDCHPYILAGQALTRLPFGRASDCYPCRFTCQSGSHPIALRYICVLAIWAYTQLLPMQRRLGSHPIAIR